MSNLSPKPIQYDVHKVIHALRHPPADTMLVAAHRGMRFQGYPEHSLKCLELAMKCGFALLEVDIQLSSDGIPVLLNKDGLGAHTDVAEQHGKGECLGYNPLVKDTTWKDMNKLRLKDPWGNISKEGITRLVDVLDMIYINGYNVVVLLDFKDKSQIAPCVRALAGRTNSSGIPAIDWMVLKTSAAWYPFPEDLENEPWWGEALLEGMPSIIPAYRIHHIEDYPALDSLKGFSDKVYLASIEINAKSLKHPVMERLHAYRRSDEFSVPGFGSFVELRDMPPSDETETFRYDTGNSVLPWDVRRSLKHDKNGPKSHVSELDLQDPDYPVDQSLLNHLARFKDLGYSWMIGQFHQSNREICVTGYNLVQRL